LNISGPGDLLQAVGPAYRGLTDLAYPYHDRTAIVTRWIASALGVLAERVGFEPNRTI